MKPFLLCLFLIPVLSFAQKHDTKIIVAVTDTSNIIKRVADVLNERGYTIDQQSEKFVSTKEKGLQKASAPTEIKLRAFFKEGTLTFTGEFKVNLNLFGEPPSFSQIENRGAKNSLFKISWTEMEDIAKQFGSVSYSR
jgi:hypothetical protein